MFRLAFFALVMSPVYLALGLPWVAAGCLGLGVCIIGGAILLGR